MRTKPLRWSAVAALAVAALAGCGGRELRDLEEESADAWAAAKAYGVARRAEAERAFAASMDRLSRSYDVAKAKAAAAGRDASKTLEPRWDEAKRRMEELRSASADGWERARDAFVRAYQAFEREMMSSGS